MKKSRRKPPRPLIERLRDRQDPLCDEAADALVESEQRFSSLRADIEYYLQAKKRKGEYVAYLRGILEDARRT
jgi:hypothetical protein